jgi:excisionase family DNA binding protein
MAKGKDKMLTVKEAAERVGASAISVRIWASQGRFKGARKEETPVGGYWLIPESALEGFTLRKAGRPFKPEAELKNKRRVRKTA